MRARAIYREQPTRTRRPRAHDLDGAAGLAARRVFRGEAEVGDAGGEILGHEDVERLDVAVHEAVVVDLPKPQRRRE